MPLPLWLSHSLIHCQVKTCTSTLMQKSIRHLLANDTQSQMWHWNLEIKSAGNVSHRHQKKKVVPEISPLQEVVLCENVIFEIKGPSNWIMQ